MRIERLGEVKCVVGEGPVWDPQSETLFFVDLVGKQLYRYEPGTNRLNHWSTPSHIAGISLDAGGSPIVALADGFYRLDFSTGECELVASAHLPEGTQINDVKVDRDGRFIGGSMSQDMKSPAASLFVLDEGGVRTLDSDYILINGPCWSPDGTIFYCSDSIRGTIYAYDYDRQNGTVANRRTFAQTAAEGGIPDGATVDTDGNMWVAMLGSGNLVVYAPDGSILRRAAMPTKFVSSVCFGGPELDRLYVTSLDPSVVGQIPDEGASFVYVVDNVGARGLADARLRI